jgi:hypothetical protein
MNVFWKKGARAPRVVDQLPLSLLDFSLMTGGIGAVGNISSPAISAWPMDLFPEQNVGQV